MKQVYQQLASLVQARLNCQQSGNGEWLVKHVERIGKLVADFLPSGSGIDNGVYIDLDESKPDRLVFDFAFHHMNDHGMYVGWTDHRLIVKPSLAFGFVLRITGRDCNQVKDYLYDTFDVALRGSVSE